MVSRPTTSAVRKVPELARPSFLPVRSSTTSGVRPNFSTSFSVASMPAMPTRLAMKLGVSCARTTPLPSVLVTKASRSSSTCGCVVGVLISSTRNM
ncbi:hypothetical protein FQZ97_835070 [compost metagenome]